jgi:transcriptional regulator with XRE-family HTH domain
MELLEIGQLIKARREYFNMKQEDLAEMSQVGIKTIHQVETGKGNPTLANLSKLCEVVGLEIKVGVKTI